MEKNLRGSLQKELKSSLSPSVPASCRAQQGTGMTYPELLRDKDWTGWYKKDSSPGGTADLPRAQACSSPSHQMLSEMLALYHVSQQIFTFLFRIFFLQPHQYSLHMQSRRHRKFLKSLKLKLLGIHHAEAASVNILAYSFPVSLTHWKTCKMGSFKISFKNVNLKVKHVHHRKSREIHTKGKTQATAMVSVLPSVLLTGSMLWFFLDSRDCRQVWGHPCGRQRSVQSRLWFLQWPCMDVRVGLQKRLSTEELMLLNCGVGEDS